ncbi:MAG: 7-cyano-7-deazaguanine synthase QueC [Phycisphaerae bacterium]|nr:7-cyano-7-deazaguanine synthase QueC [Phycisphaerae bacterium]
MASQTTNIPESLQKKGTPRAVILLSGGLDSYTSAAMAQAQGFTCYGLTVDYGQRHACELNAAYRVAKHLNIAEHKTVKLDLRAFGGSSLTDEISVPKNSDDLADSTQIPSTYVPARNTILLSLALGWAEVLGAFDLFIGANAVDYSGYPDCRAEFIGSFERLANLATKAAVEGKGQFKVHAPLLFMSKGQIIRSGHKLNLDYGITHSCYDPTKENLPCGQCDSCMLRLKGFDEAHLKDPLTYATTSMKE